MIRYSPRAIRDLEEAEVTDAYRDGREVTVELIESFRGIGHPIMDRPAIRVFRHERHKIYYLIEGSDLWIVRVLHEARQVPRRLGGKRSRP